MSHAIFPPSGAERWLKCGYSVKMAPLFPSYDTPASLNGTKHHNIAAMHLVNDTEPGIKGLQLYTDEVRKVAVDGLLFVERKVVIEPELCHGTMDAGVVRPDEWANLFDLKWGTSPVHATNNPQLKLYAMGTLREFPLPLDAHLRLSIVQPNGKSGWPVKHWDTTPRAILAFRPEVERAFEEGLKPEPKAVAGSWCYWCPAKMHCQAYLRNRK